VPTSGYVHTDASATCAWSVVESATPAEIDDVVRALEAEHADPIAVRFDDAETPAARGWT
jgi:hypothetical protein